MTVDPSPQPPSVGIRPEIWNAAKPAWENGLLEHAIFDAFKKVESLLQTRLGSASIGDALVEQAFPDGSAPRIDITSNSLDTRRLAQIFKGSIGLFKGARSHGSESPSIPVLDDPEFGLRLLAWASVLVDLLERDIKLAPAFQGLPQIGEGVLAVWVDKVDGSIKVFIDGQQVSVVSQVGHKLEVSLQGLSAGRHEVVLGRGNHRSRPEWFDMPSTDTSQNWHRVMATTVPTYEDQRCTRQRDIRTVLLESQEGGHRYRRVFPSETDAAPGDYVDWTWSLDSPTVGESWVRIDGQTHYGWTSSLPFSGTGRRPTESSHATRLTPRPGTVRLRPGTTLPLRVLVEYTDGIGVWQEERSHDAAIVSSDGKVAFVEPHGIVRAKNPGQSRLLIDCLNMHTEVLAEVAALPRGTITEYLGGIPNPRAVATVGPDLYVVTGSEVLWKMNDHERLASFLTVPLPYLAVNGLDQLTASPHGMLAVRELSSRRTLVIDPTDPSRTVPLTIPNPILTPMASVWTGERLLVLDHSGLAWPFDIDSDSEPVPLWEGPSNPIGCAVEDDRLLVITGGIAPALYVLDLETGRIQENLLESGGPRQPSALLLAGDTLWACDFYDGSLWAREGGAWKQLGGGLRNPSSLAMAEDGSIFIAEFGADVVARWFA
jgi:hypothetical protein